MKVKGLVQEMKGDDCKVTYPIHFKKRSELEDGSKAFEGRVLSSRAKNSISEND